MNHANQIGKMRQIVNKLDIKNVTCQYGSIVSATTSCIITVSRDCTVNLLTDGSIITTNIVFTKANGILTELKLDINDSKLITKIQRHIDKSCTISGDEYVYSPSIPLLLEIFKNIKISCPYSIQTNRCVSPPCILVSCSHSEFILSILDGKIRVEESDNNNNGKKCLLSLSDPELICRLQAIIYNP